MGRISLAWRILTDGTFAQLVQQKLQPAVAAVQAPAVATTAAAPTPVIAPVAPAKAVAAGRVVYADWLRGFGNLLIVDHGEDYLSLYGYNEALLKQVGESVGAGETLATVGSMTLMSRILGFVRDTVIARIFGAGLATDAFFVAFKIPNFLRRLFAEGAFSQAFVPILSEYKNRRGEDELRDLIDYVSGMLALALFVVVVIGVLAAPYIIYVSAPGFARDPGKFNLTVDLLRITFPYILFISLTALAGGILNTFSRFAVPAFTPVLLNVSFIVFAAWLTPYFDPPAKALAWAVFTGGVLQLAFQIPFLWRMRALPRFKLNLQHEGVRRVLARHIGPNIAPPVIVQAPMAITYLGSGIWS